MHRNQILGLFDQYKIRFPEESEVIGRITNFVESYPNCFSRELPNGHITGSAWLLDATLTKVLLTHHKKLNIWIQLGGHADGDCDIAQVALRESQAESGIEDISFLSSEIFDIDIHLIPERSGEPAHFHYDCRFLLRANEGAYVVGEESHDLSWIALTDLPRFTQEDSMLRMMKKSFSRS